MENIVIANSYELWKYLFVECCDEVIAYPYNGFLDSRIGYLFWRITHSKKLGMPFVELWNKWLLHKCRINDGSTVVFLNPAIWSEYITADFINSLKKRNVKIALLILDSMNVVSVENSKKIMEFVPMFDNKIYTFDINDARVYGWKQCYSYYSKLDFVKPIGEKYDVVCIMYTKNNNRLKKAIEIYDILLKKGIKCFFSLLGVSDEEKKKYYRGGVMYNQYYSYENVIGRTIQANVILEITQEKQAGSTLRAFEAVVYNKKLLTNCTEITNFPYYNGQYMKTFSDIKEIENIDNSFFYEDTVDYHYANEFSPQNLFEDIKNMK